MSRIVDARHDAEAAVADAADALRSGELVVLPTDTLYGVAADAFTHAATNAIFSVKRRARSFPLPVLIRGPKQLLGLMTAVPEAAERLMAAYWPGPLTMVVPADPNLSWDLGENRGTVAVRMPFDDVALRVIREVGPLAVTSANLSGQPPAPTAEAARAALGDAVSVYVDGGPRRARQASTIVDLTRAEPHVLRAGPIPGEEALQVARGELDPTQVTQVDPPDTTPLGDPAAATVAGRRPASADLDRLAEVPRLGRARAEALIAHFGSVAAVRAATPEQLRAVEGVGPRLADAVLDALRD